MSEVWDVHHQPFQQARFTGRFLTEVGSESNHIKLSATRRCRILSSPAEKLRGFGGRSTTRRNAEASHFWNLQMRHLDADISLPISIILLPASLHSRLRLPLSNCI